MFVVFAMRDYSLQSEQNIPQIENIFKRYLLKEGIKRLAVVEFEAGSIFAMKRFFELYSLESKLPFF